MDVRVHETDDGRHIDVAGEVDLSTSSSLWKQVEPLLDGGGRIRIRLADVSFIDTSGIAVLLRIYKRLRESGDAFVVEAPSETVRSVLELTKLTQILPIEEDA